MPMYRWRRRINARQTPRGIIKPAVVPNKLEGVAIDAALRDALEVIVVPGGCDNAVRSHTVGDGDMSQEGPPLTRRTRLVGRIQGLFERASGEGEVGECSEDEDGSGILR